MKTLVAFLCLLIFSCAPRPKIGSITIPPKGTVVKSISAPEITAVSAKEDAAELRKAARDAGVKAGKVETSAGNVRDQAGNAAKAGAEAFEKGLLAGSAEAAQLRDRLDALKTSADLSASLAMELFAEVEKAQEKAAALESKAGILESNNGFLTQSNFALKTELLETRVKLGEAQDEAHRKAESDQKIIDSARTIVANAEAATVVQNKAKWRWIKTSGALAVVVAVLGALLYFKP